MSKTPSVSELSHIYLQYRDCKVREKEEEERQSEQRIRFFLSLITGIAAFIGILLREKTKSTDLLTISLISSIILFFFGLLTFSKIIWSVAVIDSLKKAIPAMDKLFFELNPIILQKLEKEGVRSPRYIKILSHIKGTYAQYMYLIECLLGAGIVVLLGFSGSIPLNETLIFAFLINLQLLILLIIWSNYVRKGVSKSIFILPSNRQLILIKSDDKYSAEIKNLGKVNKLVRKEISVKKKKV